jgi:alpha-glucosidase
VVYQIYPRSFRDSNGDGVGDLRGIESKLDYFVDLGVGAIWISPFYPSPMLDFGYDVTDYCDVDPLFGSLDDITSLVTQAHMRNLKVIVDFVPNHTSDQHPWFLEAKSSRTSAKRDWYVWRDASDDPSHDPSDDPSDDPSHDPSDSGYPNNWLSLFGGPAWTLDEATTQYYLHSFLPEQPDLNWRNPEVRQAMNNVITFWLDRGVDGFRLDVAHHIGKDPELRSNPWLSKGQRTDYFKDMGEWGRQVHLHDSGHPDLLSWYADIRHLLDSYPSPDGSVPDRFAVGEIHEFDWHRWATYFGSRPGEGLHMPFNFSLLKAGWNADRILQQIRACESVVPAWGWPSWVLGNHDESRVATRFGSSEAAKAALVLLLTLRGLPTLYYGDELGMTDVPIIEDQVRDPWGKRMSGMGLGRDPERTPMPWNPSAHVGFCDDDIEPWLPIGVESLTGRVNVEQQLGDPNSFLTLARSLLRLRVQHEALATGDWREVVAPSGVIAFDRISKIETIRVVIRVGDTGSGTDSSSEVTDNETELVGVSEATGLVLASTHKQVGATCNTSRLRLPSNCAMVILLD